MSLPGRLGAAARRGAAAAGGAAATLRRLLSRLWIRLLAFNVLLVFLPAAGLLILDTYEGQLLDAQERAMVQQGRFLAAALSGRGELDAAEAQRIIEELDRRLESRLRVVDRAGRVLADSAALGPRRDEAGAPYPGAGEQPRKSWLYRLGSALNRAWRSLSPAPEVSPDRPGLYRADEPDGALTGPAVRRALTGRYGADLRVVATEDGAVTMMHSAIPVTGSDETGRPVVGAVLVSQSTARILASLGRVRLAIFQVIVASIVAAVVLSLLVATTIARPLGRLRDEARAIVDRRGRLTGGFHGSRKEDEIGELTRALEELTRRLSRHLDSMESFASDVSHEFKNPLASIRSAAEMLAAAETADERRRFEGIVLREVARLQRLLTSLREISALDASLESEPTEPVPFAELVRSVVEGYRVRRQGGDGGAAAPRVELVATDRALPVRAAPERLAQVAENLVDNAVSFSPPGGSVLLLVEHAGGEARLTVEDEGPGIPPDHLERIFDRFFSYRGGGAQRNGGRDGHAGLGLAIARMVVEGYGGTIRAENRPGGGARFEVTLPLAGR